ncbi:hypothetical protein COCSADRAFT_170432 [Bipolaris sorokiniana ND90Pr]|uniref:Transcription factor domain-containing protein n=1 Tax=Cochliobolus sativus (strain ND90Pr / ATCC 201652) TaxID=665912 RepID=M2SUR4_COCSN|nr:uncharacterized protein COCSADRAFT_170432 [Bipolaris sorokiniana ND90Pr]EMD66030.1 hypothetical protein COCSADRAFT_170432 [Bipolaris sorokiniana ND90Pr]
MRRSRRHLKEKNNQSLDKHVLTAAQPYVMSGSTMPNSSTPDHSSGVAVIGQNAEGLANLLNTPFSEECFSQLVSDSAHSYLDFDFSGETTPGTNQIQIIEPGQQTSSLQNQRPYHTPRTGTPMPDWFRLSHEQNLYEHSAAQFCDFPEIEQDDNAIECTLALFSGRIIADKAEPKPFSTYKTYRITALFQNAYGESRRQQAVLDKVKVLLSLEHQTFLTSLLSKIDSGREHQSLDLNGLPVRKLIQRAFREPGGLSLFIKEQEVTRIQERFFDPVNLPIEISDMSLLIASLAWGALLDPEVSSVSKAALLDAVLEISTLLLRQNGSIRQFLALVAVLCLAEKIGLENLPALIIGSVSIAASLSLHLDPVIRKLCDSDEQAIRTKRAMWLLYCIDKSHALRWQTFSLVSDDSLPTTNPPDDVLENDSATTPSLEWLWIRSQYSKICSNILQLTVSAEEKPSEDRSNRAVTLSTALSEWYRSTRISQMMLSLDHSNAMRAKLQTSYYYYEARFQLLSISLPNPQSSSLAEFQECRGLLKRSIREIIALSHTIPSEYLVQDYTYLFMNKLALCLLALDILLDLEQDCGKESRALLSMIGGFFARVDMILPQSTIFKGVSDLIEILTYR